MVGHRRQDWPLRLNAWLESVRTKRFVWGEHDCALGAADAVLMMTGTDPAAAFRGRYTSKVGAALIIVEHGGLEAMVTAALGDPLPTPKLARRGDVVLVDSPEGQAIAVVLGASAAGPGPDGAVFVPMEGWKAAWRV